MNFQEGGRAPRKQLPAWWHVRGRLINWECRWSGGHVAMSGVVAFPAPAPRHLHAVAHAATATRDHLDEVPLLSYPLPISFIYNQIGMWLNVRYLVETEPLISFRVLAHSKRFQHTLTVIEIWPKLSTSDEDLF